MFKNRTRTFGEIFVENGQRYVKMKESEVNSLRNAARYLTSYKNEVRSCVQKTQYHLKNAEYNLQRGNYVLTKRALNNAMWAISALDN